MNIPKIEGKRIIIGKFVFEVVEHDSTRFSFVPIKANIEIDIFQVVAQVGQVLTQALCLQYLWVSMNISVVDLPGDQKAQYHRYDFANGIETRYSLRRLPLSKSLRKLGKIRCRACF